MLTQQSVYAKILAIKSAGEKILGREAEATTKATKKMSEWVVLDITAFTKTTTAEKVKKILKQVNFETKKLI